MPYICITRLILRHAILEIMDAFLDYELGSEKDLRRAAKEMKKKLAEGVGVEHAPLRPRLGL